MRNKYIFDIKIYFIFAFFFLLLMVFINYKLDYYGLFNHKDYLKKATNIILNGGKVAGLQNFDERTFQKLIIKSSDKEVDVIALGSSRTMELRANNFPNKIFFNHSVSGASLEDYIGILGSYIKYKNHIPSEIIMGIDPWIFNKNNEQTRWKVLGEEYLYYLNSKLSIKKTSSYFNNKKLKELVSYDYLITNLKFLYNKYIMNKLNVFKINSANNKYYIRDYDGSLHYPLSVLQIGEHAINLKAKSFISGKLYSMENFHSLDNIEIFEKLIISLIKANKKVNILLSPFHPIVYDYILKNKKYENVLKVEKYLQKLSLKYNIKLMGSYNPYILNFRNIDFIDGFHPRGYKINDIFKSTRLKI